jgi:ABC-type phosphate transport system substrate-binding protein
VVYSGNNPYSVSHSFAGHFGYETGSLKGKKIAGDDIYLNNAVKKDVKGISFNNLNYIFNIESRQLNEGISLLPLDIKKEYAEVLNAQNLDETITLLENKNIDLIPVEELAFVLPGKVNPATIQFLEWALSEGQDYIHSFGFLRLDAKTLAQQRKDISALETKLLVNK